ncbi:hypothetical protein EDC96DRAFT_531998 [Choanephora cucurbitarum]|nr:hypothetical protein EDC96DRAFT_531998 [Choanephora cucurbitarum]
MQSELACSFTKQAVADYVLQTAPLTTKHFIEFRLKTDQKVYPKCKIPNCFFQIHYNKSTKENFSFDVKRVKGILSFGINDNNFFCPSEYWYNGIECSRIVADTYKIAVTIMDGDKANKPTLMVPICAVILEKLPIVLQFKAHRCNILMIEEDCVYPPINPIYSKINMDIEDTKKKLIQCQRLTKKNKDSICI